MYIMKKNILYSLLISTVATVGLSSCDAFLEENPKDQITEEQAYQNSTLLYLNTVASLYTQVGANGGGSGLQGTDRGLYDLNTFTTDEAVLPTRGGDWYDGGLWQDVFLHKWGTKNDLVKGSWDYLYRVIAQANKSLDKLNEILYILRGTANNTGFLDLAVNPLIHISERNHLYLVLLCRNCSATEHGRQHSQYTNFLLNHFSH